ncbi:hypothetical protein C8J56DRAFT_1156467 [Mycena floridula]|nr:hypothetical protein C8J56DRAFT_1156467 [Mycena floridula]
MSIASLLSDHTYVAQLPQFPYVAPAPPFPSSGPIINSIQFHATSTPSSTRYNVKINRQTTLSKLYTYEDPASAYVEYPETGALQPVGYLFRMSNEGSWDSPALNFAYSLGAPSGHSQKEKQIFLDIMTDSDSGQPVPCLENHYTCQGAKVCPQTDIEKLCQPHIIATRDAVSSRLAQDHDARLLYGSPSADVFRKTQNLIASLRHTGCRAARAEQNVSDSNRVLNRHQTANSILLNRGYQDPIERCEGQLELQYDRDDNPYIVCQYYHPETDRDHHMHYLDGSYDADYLEAYFSNDEVEMARIEQAAQALGYGPLVECTTVLNASTQRACCPSDHRDAHGQLLQPALRRLECAVKFRIFQPFISYRSRCPYILIIVKGIHPHPIPLPIKTPPRVKTIILNLLDKLGSELADLTARRFLRHSIVRGYLTDNFPGEVAPVLSDIHSAASAKFPYGTGLQGVRHLKEMNDKDLPVEKRYIRRIISADSDHLIGSDEIIVCMTVEQSRRLLRAQYIEGDVAFKRVKGYKEFELACFDRDSNTSVVFCRVFITAETAELHQRVFAEIDSIVYEDTMNHLRWRHLHAHSIDDFDGCILQFAGDQHGGQAKGFGLYLQLLAQKLPGQYDLHEPHRLLSELSPYDHLHRIFRLCEIHIYRNIRESHATPSTKSLMRSLVCMKHPAWETTLKRIADEGGKIGQDWIANKINSQFALQGMCWEKSFIPRDIWAAANGHTNLIESVHYDVNIEGKDCSLLGGIEKGHAYDSMKMKAQLNIETFGIRTSCQSGHRVENALRGVKRSYNLRHKHLVSEDAHLEKAAKKLRTFGEELHSHRNRVDQSALALITATDETRSQRQGQLDEAASSLVETTERYSELEHEIDQMPKGTGTFARRRRP